jgi:hypothetical protein
MAEPGGTSTEELARTFRRFAEADGPHHKSRLYEEFSYAVAQAPEVLALASGGQPGQPAPNLLFAAVHYLLLSGVKHPLRDYYPGLSAGRCPSGPAYPAFRNFCLEHRESVARLISTRLVQTNVVARSVCLLPAFATVAATAGGQPLAQIEVGASAGLNLLWERYRFDYGGGLTWGDPASPVRVTTELRGDVPLPPMPASLGALWAAGIDLNPIDVEDSDAVLWLRALVWPGHLDQQEQLLGAIDLARAQRPSLVRGDAAERLPELLMEAPPQATLCVFATHTLHQFTADSLRTMLKAMQQHARSRPLYFVYMEGTGNGCSELKLTRYDGDARTDFHLANCHPHGRWLEWLDAD